MSSLNGSIVVPAIRVFTSIVDVSIYDPQLDASPVGDIPILVRWGWMKMTELVESINNRHKQCQRQLSVEAHTLLSRFYKVNDYKSEVIIIINFNEKNRARAEANIWHDQHPMPDIETLYVPALWGKKMIQFHFGK